ncbi:zinc finger domain-containing protein [Streptomyces clavuligerus]|uniref:zinc finger domain-containing protein n=6 Tax=Streptomyces clavuligerus TaxID=1901 RepID=UPI00020D939D|nr:hypothetical protein [Streptomyces clavuligerus]WDN56068.1 hypothetical protein LL058_29770 [Streptomyces clavuligerus]
MGGTMVPGGGDRRRIQTAVLGSADSQEPLVLPLEPIELDAFRSRSAGQTFWCGTWLGGCARQLTTKLYTDRVCHFSHMPHHVAGADPAHPPCTRRDRDVAGADHLYIKAAAEQLLRAARLPGEAVCSPPGHQNPAGSRIDLTLGGGTRITFCLDRLGQPDWNDPATPARTVLAEVVPVDRAVLQRLRYIHRVRCESDGTGRRVLIGTQTADGTHWHPLDGCTLGPTGLHTPSLDRLPARPLAKAPAREPAPPRRRMSREVRSLLLRLATARASRDQARTRALIRECDDLLHRPGPELPVVRQARDSARLWLGERSGETVRSRGNQLAALVSTPGEARGLEKPHNLEDRYAAERRTRLAELGTAVRDERHRDVRSLLREISRIPPAAHPDPGEAHLLQQARSLIRAANSQGLLQERVARRHWLRHTCPACGAGAGQDCHDQPAGAEPLRRPGGHDDRRLLAARDREHKQRTATTGTSTQDLVRKTLQVECPTCTAPAGRPCPVPGCHPARLRRYQSQQPW